MSTSTSIELVLLEVRNPRLHSEFGIKSLMYGWEGLRNMELVEYLYLSYLLLLLMHHQPYLLSQYYAKMYSCFFSPISFTCTYIAKLAHN
jgi:hypothetical protein